jgi:hypothetical protein
VLDWKPDEGQSGNGTGTSVPDLSPPSITAPSSLVEEATALITEIESIGEPIVSDNSDTLITVTNNAPADGYPLGRTIVEWTATDAAGNKATARQNVTIQDTTAPSIASPARINTKASGALTPIALAPPAVSDLYDAAPAVTNNASANGFPVGKTFVNWTVTDRSGNEASVLQEVRVTKPELEIPIVSASPPGGPFSKAVSVHLSGTASTEKIYYTLDGSAPSSSTAAYVGPIRITTTTTLRFVAVDAFGNHGVSESQTYTIDSAAPKVMASPEGNSFRTEKMITLSADERATIYYTMDGSDPSPLAKVYSSPIPISATTTLKYFARDPAGNNGAVQKQLYVIDTISPSVRTSHPGGAYASGISVTLTASELATIFYTTDGSEPTPLSKKYSSAIPISKSTTLKFIARDIVGNVSPAVSSTIMIDSDAPEVFASPGAGLYRTPQTIKLTTDQPATIYYTMDGKTPNTSSRIYESSLTISGNVTLRYFAKDLVGNVGSLSSEKYVIDTAAPQVNATPRGGTYPGAITVALNSNELDASIFYTMDGSAPTRASKKYVGEVAIPATVTLKYIVIDRAGNEGSVGVQTYVMDDISPRITPPANIVVEASGRFTFIQTLGKPAASDNMGPVTVTHNSSSMRFVLGDNKVMWTAKDAVGNKAIATQLVVVRDTTAPTLTGLNDVKIEIASHADATKIALGVPVVRDLVDSSPRVSNDAPTTGFPVGVSTVTWTARDASANQAMAVQKVTVTVAPQQEQKLLIRIMTINNDESTRTTIRSHLDEDDFVNNFRLPVLGMYPGQNQALNEQSIAAVKNSIASEIPASKVDVDYIEYDNEAGNGGLSTPESELVDPASATNEAVKTIKEAGYKAGVAPTRRILMQELPGVEWSRVDYVVMQLQKVVGTQEFRDTADKVSATSKSQNPDIKIFAQVNPALNSVEEIVDAIDSIRDDIDGVGIVWTMNDASQLDKLLTALGR